MIMSVDHLIKSHQLPSTGCLAFYIDVFQLTEQLRFIRSFPVQWTQISSGLSGGVVKYYLKPLRFIRGHIFCLRSTLIIGARMSWGKISLLSQHASTKLKNMNISAPYNSIFTTKNIIQI